MSRTSLAAPAAALALTVLAIFVHGGPHTAWGTPAPGAPVLDSARAEMAVGRFWHAARLLAPLEAEGQLDREGLILFARAEAGYRNWRGVARLLEPLAPTEDGGEVWHLLALAREALDDPAGAADAYERALATPPTAPLVLQGRRARALWRADDHARALAGLDGVDDSAARSWLALELLHSTVEQGDTAGTRALMARVAEREPAERSRGALARSRWQAEDTAGSVAEYQAVLAAEPPRGLRAEAWLALGRAARAVGDTAGAVAAFREVIAAAPRASEAGPAAAGLADLATLDAADALAVARVLDRAGDGRRALAAYDRHVALSEEAGAEADPAARVERARLMASLAQRQQDAIDEYRALSTHDDPAVGARALELWAELRRRQGRSGDEATLRRWLVERYPETAAATGVVFFRGDDAHDRGDLARALDDYGRVVEMAPSMDLAGLSRMRMGQILLRADRLDEALAVYEGYLADFPQGRRWDEASYWAARIRLARADTAGGMRHLDRLQTEDPFSYYSVLTADLLQRPFEVGDLPPGPDTPVPAWISEGLARMDLFQALALEPAATHTGAELARRAGAEGAAALYALAEGFNARGRTLDGINLGWEIRRGGEPWNLRLLRIVYPFPYREMVVREAREWGVDPFLLAGLIRQESAWVKDIVSSAGAIGLMQVMPSTGRGLARQSGIEGFTEASLETPEVNLHLGARFLVDVMERYGPDLPLVLSAYNAGPARAERWKAFPEAGDPLHLTERIPFGETRGYVKNVTRNLRLYEALYGAPTRVAR